MNQWGAQIKSRREKTWQIIFMLFVALFLLVFLTSMTFFTIQQVTFDKKDMIVRWCEEYTGSWTVSVGDQTLTGLTAPFTVKDEAKEPAVLSTVLPDTINDDTVFCLSNGRDCIIEVDGEVRFSFDSSDTPLPGAVVKSLVKQVALTSEDAGKTLTIYRTGSHRYNANLGTCYLGNSLGIFEVYFHTYGLLLVLAGLLLVISLFMILLGLISQLTKNRNLRLLLLGFCFFVPSLWLICDNPLFQFVFHTYIIEGTFEYILTILAPVPFILYVNYEQKNRYLKYHTAFLILEFAGGIFFTTCHFRNVWTFEASMVPMNIMVSLVVAGILFTLVCDARKGYYREYLLFLVGLAGLGVFGIVDIILMNSDSGWMDGIAVLLGLYFLMFCSIAHILFQAKKAIQEAEAAVTANKTKSDFLANMSHEIRTPINAIMGMDEMILEENADGNIREYAGNIQTACNNLLDIVNDILDLSKIEAGQMELVPEEYHLSSLLNDVVTMMEVRAREKKLAFQVEVDPSLPNVLYGDEGRIRQILINLLNNAVKYTNEGSVQLYVKKAEEPSTTGETEEAAEEILLKLAVKDTGIGIRPEDRERLFDSFTRVDRKKNKNVEGTGLGLSIVSSLVEKMKGSIRVESTYGEGSAFLVTIPQRVVKNEPIGDFRKQDGQEEEEQQETETFTAPDAKILLVDDTEMNLKVAKGLLRKSQVQVTCLTSGSEMLERITKEHFDVILLDHMMPDLDGVETLRKSKELSAQGKNLCRDTPIVVMTANAIKGAREEYLSMGFDDYISKPMKGKDLEAMIQSKLKKDQ